MSHCKQYMMSVWLYKPYTTLGTNRSPSIRTYYETCKLNQHLSFFNSNKRLVRLWITPKILNNLQLSKFLKVGTFPQINIIYPTTEPQPSYFQFLRRKKIFITHAGTYPYGLLSSTALLTFIQPKLTWTKHQNYVFIEKNIFVKIQYGETAKKP